MNQPTIIEDDQQQPRQITSSSNDLTIVCQYCSEIHKSLFEMRSLLFQNVQLDSNSWQVQGRGSNLSRKRWNWAILVEQYIVELEPDPWRFRNEMAIIAHTIEYFLFKTAPCLEMYSDIHNLRRRGKCVLHYMAIRVMLLQSNTTEKVNDEESPYII